MTAGRSHDMLRALAACLIAVSVGLLMLAGCGAPDSGAKPGAEYQTEAGEEPLRSPTALIATT